MLAARSLLLAAVVAVLPSAAPSDEESFWILRSEDIVDSPVGLGVLDGTVLEVGHGRAISRLRNASGFALTAVEIGVERGTLRSLEVHDAADEEELARATADTPATSLRAPLDPPLPHHGLVQVRLRGLAVDEDAQPDMLEVRAGAEVAARVEEEWVPVERLPDYRLDLLANLQRRGVADPTRGALGAVVRWSGDLEDLRGTVVLPEGVERSVVRVVAHFEGGGDPFEARVDGDRFELDLRPHHLANPDIALMLAVVLDGPLSGDRAQLDLEGVFAR